MENKFILDACCGPKYMWFNKQHPNVVYMDNRREEKGYFDYRKNQEIQPDIVADFRKMPFGDKTFKLVVWDPPHLKMKKISGGFAKTFGVLHPETWQDDLKRGFKECWRVLDDYGTLIFKFSDFSISFKQVLSLFPETPLFGNTSSRSKNAETKWFCFMKIPNGVKRNSSTVEEQLNEIEVKK